ncbi:MAG: hypothetical protein MAG715_00355 [Methanonatronarchaeales archaeon]|nr:hypothetical protein [Methanonatronarchaeales archaeon]
MATFEVGDEVRDREDRDPDAAVVVNTPPVKCRNWNAYRDDGGNQVSVADDNLGYDAAANVVVVAFKDELEGTGFDVEPGSPVKITDLNDAEVMSYAFPPWAAAENQGPRGRA